MSTLSVRMIASKCLRKFGSLSLKEDIFSLRNSPPPQSLKSELKFIREFRCPPKAPTNLRVTEVNERAISLAWNDNADNEEGFEIVWRGERKGYVDDDGSRRINGSNRENYTLTRLKEGFEYCIRVRAFNKGGNSDDSSEVCAKIPISSPPAQGYRQVVFFNCHINRRKVYFWIRDITAGSPWSQRGSLLAQYSSSGSCPAPDTSPFVISLTDNHLYELVAVDPALIGCGGRNDPLYGACRKFHVQAIRGDTDGSILPVTVN